MNLITQSFFAYKGNIATKVNPDLQHLSSYIESMPQWFDNNGETIRCVRNHIKVLEVDGKRINIKKYAIPSLFINRIASVLFREPKAKRHYDYALKLRDLGFNSPTPIGYYLEKSGVFLSHCYLATEQVDDMYRLADLDKIDITTSHEHIFTEFGRYTALLHKSGVYHGDYSLGNILFRVDGDKVNFSLVDINRMSFSGVSLSRGYKNFHRFGIDPEDLKIISYAYAEEMNCDKETMFNKIISYRDRKIKFRKFKRGVKAKLKGKKSE